MTVRVEGMEDGFAIEDDGPGIDETDQHRLFERGYSSEEDGVGFGLYIVEQIATAHGWEVTASNGESGARFEFRNVTDTSTGE